MSTQPIFAADSYKNIKGYAIAFKDLLNYKGSGIVTSNPDDENLIIYFEIEKINELIGRLQGTGAVYLAGVLGVHDNEAGNPEFTIGLLGALSNRNIVQGHIDGIIPGEEVWPYRKIVSDIGTALP